MQNMQDIDELYNFLKISQTLTQTANGPVVIPPTPEMNQIIPGLQKLGFVNLHNMVFMFYLKLKGKAKVKYVTFQEASKSI